MRAFVRRLSRTARTTSGRGFTVTPRQYLCYASVCAEDGEAPTVRVHVFLPDAFYDALLELLDYWVLEVDQRAGLSCTLRDLLLKALGDAQRYDLVDLVNGDALAGRQEVVLDELPEGDADVAGDAVSLGVAAIAGNSEVFAEVQDQLARLRGEVVLAHLADLPLSSGALDAEDVRRRPDELLYLLGAHLADGPPADPGEQGDAIPRLWNGEERARERREVLRG